MIEIGAHVVFADTTGWPGGPRSGRSADRVRRRAAHRGAGARVRSRNGWGRPRPDGAATARPAAPSEGDACPANQADRRVPLRPTPARTPEW